MKLILSSCDFRNDNARKTIIDNLSKPISQCKLLYIPNEKATFETINDAELSAAEYTRLAERGYISFITFLNGAISFSPSSLSTKSLIAMNRTL